MVLVFAGPMRGAAGLTAAAALRAGAGFVVLDGSERAPFSAIVAESDAKFGERRDDPRVGDVVIVPGFPAGAELLFDVEAALDSGKPTVRVAVASDQALLRPTQATRKA